ncbi:MAG TPA: glycerol-3-phosphate 1-O-acyltransferase PlsY [Terriglobales bacterium]|nr:glycerol-3-phosphate 1-O-acyltransferase PlsY [Terriglobales bacterium]
MLPLASATALLVTAFLLGSIPFGYLLYRLRTGGDIRAAGSGNIGATNVLRAAGVKLGLATLALDALKGWLAVELALRFAGAHPALIASALALVVLGHMYSPWLRFRGGKGVATALGAFLALAPLPMAEALVVFAAVLAVWRYVSLASICACIALPLLMLTSRTRFPAAELATASGLALLIIVRHRANLARLRRGTENKLGTRAGAAI